jgi:hypothetical protein
MIFKRWIYEQENCKVEINAWQDDKEEQAHPAFRDCEDEQASHAEPRGPRVAQPQA